MVRCEVKWANGWAHRRGRRARRAHIGRAAVEAAAAAEAAEEMWAAQHAQHAQRTLSVSDSTSLLSASTSVRSACAWGCGQRATGQTSWQQVLMLQCETSRDPDRKGAGGKQSFPPNHSQKPPTHPPTCRVWVAEIRSSSCSCSSCSTLLRCASSSTCVECSACCGEGEGGRGRGVGG